MLQRCVVYSLKSMCFKFTDIRQLFIYFSIMCCVVRFYVIGEVANKYIRVAVIGSRFHFLLFTLLCRFLILLFICSQERWKLGLPMFEKHWYIPYLAHIFINGGSIPYVFLYKIYIQDEHQKLWKKHQLSVNWKNIAYFSCR